MPADNTEDIKDAADRLFAAIERTDVEYLNDVFHPDVAVWRTGAPGDDDKRQALRVLTWFINRTTDRRYQVLDRQIFDGDSGRGFVQQHILHATRTSTGAPFAMRVCLVANLTDDLRIGRIDEYFDPADLAPLLV